MALFFRLSVVMSAFFAFCPPSFAQFTPAANVTTAGGFPTMYYVTGSATFNSTTPNGSFVYVGKTTSNVTLPGSFALNIVPGARLNPGLFDGGVSVHGAHFVAMTGGTISTVYAYDTATATISGGTVGSVGADNGATVTVSGGTVTSSVRSALFGTGGVANITGGTVNVAIASGTGTTNVLGGTVAIVSAFESGTANISGGAVTNVDAGNSAKVFFSGTANIGGIVSQNFDAVTVDFAGFSVIATNAVAATHNFRNGVFYDLLWTRTDLSTSAFRYFDVNGVVGDTFVGGATANGSPILAPVVVPETGTMALAVVGITIIVCLDRSRKRSSC